MAGGANKGDRWLAVLATTTALGPLACAGYAEPTAPGNSAGAPSIPNAQRTDPWGQQDDYSLYVVPLLPPDPLPEGLQAEQLSLTGQLHSASPDGSTLVGRTDWTYVPEDESEFHGGVTWFVWTAESETVSVPGGLSAEVVASDGGLWGTERKANSMTGFSRWDMTGNTQLFDVDLQVDTGSIVEVSQGAKLVAGWIQAETGPSTTLLWRSGHDDDQFVPVSIPGNGSWPDLSTDGSRLVAVSDGVVYQASTSASPVEPSPIAAPAGYSRCDQAEVSANGSVIAGVCARDPNGEGRPATLFRWTEGDGAAQVIEPGPNLSLVMSPDGNNMLGTVSVADGNAGLSWWTPGGVIEEPIQGEVLGLSDDSQVAWVTIVDASGLNGFQETTAARWTRDGGVVRLDKLHDGSTRVAGYSATGSLAVGGFEIAYLWDSLGARDILAELNAAEVDLQGVTKLEPQRVWSGNPIRIQGRCYLGDSMPAQNVCLVTLPARN